MGFFTLKTQIKCSPRVPPDPPVWEPMQVIASRAFILKFQEGIKSLAWQSSQAKLTFRAILQFKKKFYRSRLKRIAPKNWLMDRNCICKWINSITPVLKLEAWLVEMAWTLERVGESVAPDAQREREGERETKSLLELFYKRKLNQMAYNPHLYSIVMWDNIRCLLQVTHDVTMNTFQLKAMLMVQMPMQSCWRTFCTYLFYIHTCSTL